MGADPFHGPGPSQQETADRVLETLGIRDLASRSPNLTFIGMVVYNHHTIIRDGGYK